MKDYVLFDKALKLTWVKRLCSNSDAPWKYIPNSFLSTVGGTELFQCNYSYNLLDLKGSLPEFYKQIIHHCQNIVSTTPHSKTETLSQTIWNNKFITIDRKMAPLIVKTYHDHLLISCPQASSVWYKFQRWYSTVCNASLLLSEPEVLFGIIRPCTHRLTLKHLIMLGKYFLYINALINAKFVSVTLFHKPTFDLTQ